ncbi:MAG: hypothetical protein CL899_05865 [Dehalococcoidia bacterium]|nr:hypothetical protein [Dehalococcoidia bacterium]
MGRRCRIFSRSSTLKNQIYNVIKPYLLLLPFCLGVFLGADDQTKVVTILPQIMIDFEIPITNLDTASWLIVIYLIGYTAVMPFTGRLSDKFGFRNLFIISLIIFLIGSVLTALSPEISKIFHREPNVNWILATRFIQSIGGGALVPISIAAAGFLVPRNKLPIAYGLIGASAEAGAVFGPLVGGALTEFLSWEWAFWINLPPTILIIIAVIIWIPKSTFRDLKIDYLGSIIFFLFIATLSLACAQITKSNELLIIFAVISFATLIGGIFLYKASKEFIIPKQIIKNKLFMLANLTHFFIGITLIIAIITVPVMAETILGASPLEAGLRLLRLTIALSIGAFLGGVLTQRLGARIPLILGFVLIAIGFYFMFGWDLKLADPSMTIHLAISGLGFGLCISPITDTAMKEIKDSDRGSASALLTVSRMLGMTIGLSSLTAWGTTRFAKFTSGLEGFSLDPIAQKKMTDASLNAGLDVFQEFFLIGLLVTLVAVPLSLAITLKKNKGDR